MIVNARPATLLAASASRTQVRVLNAKIRAPPVNCQPSYITASALKKKNSGPTALSTARTISYHGTLLLGFLAPFFIGYIRKANGRKIPRNNAR